MVQTIGLIVAVYAMARLMQVPIEAATEDGSWFSVPYGMRVSIVAGISLFGIGVLVMLTLALLMSGADVSGTQ